MKAHMANSSEYASALHLSRYSDGGGDVGEIADAMLGTIRELERRLEAQTKPRPMNEAPRDVLIRVFMDLEHDGASFTDCEGNDAPWAYLADGWLPASGGDGSC